MLEYLHTKRLWLVRVKFLENGLYLLCNVLTSLLHDVEHTLKPLDFQGVSVFFAHLSKFTFQGKQFAVFSV